MQADIVNLIWSNAWIIHATSAKAPTAWRRQLHLMLDADRAERAHSIPEPPMTSNQLCDAMVHLSKVELDPTNLCRRNEFFAGGIASSAVSGWS